RRDARFHSVGGFLIRSGDVAWKSLAEPRRCQPRYGGGRLRTLYPCRCLAVGHRAGSLAARLCRFPRACLAVLDDRLPAPAICRPLLSLIEHRVPAGRHFLLRQEAMMFVIDMFNK